MNRRNDSPSVHDLSSQSSAGPGRRRGASFDPRRRRLHDRLARRRPSRYVHLRVSVENLLLAPPRLARHQPLPREVFINL